MMMEAKLEMVMEGVTDPKQLITVPTRTTKRRLEDLPAPSALPWLGNLHQVDPTACTFSSRRGPRRLARASRSSSGQNAYL